MPTYLITGANRGLGLEATIGALVMFYVPENGSREVSPPYFQEIFANDLTQPSVVKKCQ